MFSPRPSVVLTSVRLVSTATIVGLSMLLVGAPDLLRAQSNGEASTSSASADEVATLAVDEHWLRVDKPRGWIEGKPGEGAVVLLRAADVSGAQIEIRVSSPISPPESAAFFTSFHNDLKAAGFARLERLPNAVYGSIAGNEIEYRGRTKGTTYRLIVWQFHRDESAWLVVGFFPESQRDLLYKDFRTIVRSIEFRAD
jgi:hypothetical protein